MTEEQFQFILDELTSGKTLSKTIRDNPHLGKYTSWAEKISKNEKWQARYRDARDLGADVTFDKLLELADAPPDTEKYGKYAVQKQKLAGDIYKYVAGKLSQRKYGDKVDVNHGGQPNNPVIAKIERVIVDTLPGSIEGDEPSFL